MLLSAGSRLTTFYPVEISGWDATHAFFVEKSQLEWNEDTGKHVLLNHALPEGALIFVRLLQLALRERASPVAYQTRFTGRTPDGRHEFLLKRAQPRAEDGPEMVQ